MQARLRDLATAAAGAGTPLPPFYHRLFRLSLAFGFPGFGAVMAIIWLMISRPDFQTRDGSGWRPGGERMAGWASRLFVLAVSRLKGGAGVGRRGLGGQSKSPDDAAGQPGFDREDQSAGKSEPRVLLVVTRPPRGNPIPMPLFEIVEAVAHPDHTVTITWSDGVRRRRFSADHRSRRLVHAAARS